jgi:mannosyltransferase
VLTREGRSPFARRDRSSSLEYPTGAELFAVFAFTVAAAVLRFWRLGHQGYWFDEANTALLVHYSPGKMLGLIPQTESTPPLYYGIAWVWARVFGYAEAGLRSLSAVCGVLLVPVAYGAGRKLISPRAGLIAAALTAFNPFLIWYSQEARSYELVALLSGASLLAFAYAKAMPTSGRVTVWALVAALALATHYYSLLVVIPEAVWLLWVHRYERPVRLAIGFVALCGLGLLVLAISQNANGRVKWISSVPVSRRLGEVVPQFLVGFGSVAYNPLVWVSIAVCGVALVLLVVLGDPEERQRTLAVGAVAVSGLALNLLLVAAGIDDLLTRNVIALWMPAALVVAGGLAVARAGWFGVALAAALCVIGVVATVSVATDRDLQRPDWRGVARVLGTEPAVGAPGAVAGRAILVQHYKDLLPLSLYLPRLSGLPPAGAKVQELDIISISDPRTAGFCWWGSACNLWASSMQPTYAVRGFHELWRRQIYQFTILRLVADHPVNLTPRAVSAALVTTTLGNDGLLIQRR